MPFAMLSDWKTFAHVSKPISNAWSSLKLTSGQVIKNLYFFAPNYFVMYGRTVCKLAWEVWWGKLTLYKQGSLFTLLLSTPHERPSVHDRPMAKSSPRLTACWVSDGSKENAFSPIALVEMSQ